MLDLREIGCAMVWMPAECINRVLVGRSENATIQSQLP
jgi:hypothetical protein